MKDTTTLRKNLESRGFDLRVFATGAEAVAYLDGKLDGRTIGIGGSMTVRELGLHEALGKHNKVAWHLDGGKIEDANAAEVYISSLNGVAETGELINIDGTGNRIAATAYGPTYIYYVIGRNKVAPDFEQALWRARNIAAPMNAARLGAKTPCVLQQPMRCHDCSSPERICRALQVHWKRLRPVKELEVILIEEDLGY